MVRVAALKNEVEEGDTGPDAAGLTPAPAAPAHLRAGPRHDGRSSTRPLLDEILPALAERGIRILRRRSRSTRAAQTALSPPLPRRDPARPHPAWRSTPRGRSRCSRSLSLNLAVLLAPAGEGEEQPAPGRRPGAGQAAAPGAAAASDGTSYVLVEEIDPRGAAAALPRPAGPGGGGLPHRARRRDGPRRRRRPRLPEGGRGGAAQAAQGPSGAPGGARRGASDDLVRLLTERAGGGAGRTSTGSPAPSTRAPSSPSWSCPRSKTCATRP